mgnify:CR=1 FL=1
MKKIFILIYFFLSLNYCSIDGINSRNSENFILKEGINFYQKFTMNEGKSLNFILKNNITVNKVNNNLWEIVNVSLYLMKFGEKNLINSPIQYNLDRNKFIIPSLKEIQEIHSYKVFLSLLISEVFTKTRIKKIESKDINNITNLIYDSKPFISDPLYDYLTDFLEKSKFLKEYIVCKGINNDIAEIYFDIIAANKDIIMDDTLYNVIGTLKIMINYPIFYNMNFILLIQSKENDRKINFEISSHIIDQ